MNALQEALSLLEECRINVDNSGLLRRITLFLEGVDPSNHVEPSVVPDRYQLVPKEPTPAMLESMDSSFTWIRAEEGVSPSYYGPLDDRYSDHRDAYKAALSAVGAKEA